MLAVKLLSGPNLGVFDSYYLVQVYVIIWSKVISTYSYSGVGQICVLSYHFVCFFVPNYLPMF